jgi:5-(aminomethyl)-3-furanmethanol phosphate kinase
MTSSVDVVVKLGGGVLACPEHLTAVLATLAAAARNQRLLVVPGGGPFADAVREVDRRVTLSDDAAHWMAVLAMEQYAHLIAARLAAATLVEDPREVAAALAAGHVPVLVPYQWLRAADPLPHSWDVTSDSIAAWVAGAVRARRLVLVKPAAVDHRLHSSDMPHNHGGNNLVDAYFDRALPPDVGHAIVAADRVDVLAAVLGGRPGCA